MTDTQAPTAEARVDALLASAQAELADERAEAAKNKLKAKLRELGSAKKIVTNIEAEIVAITDGLRSEFA